MNWLAWLGQTPPVTQFAPPDEPDWTVNAIVYVALAIALAGVYLWRKRTFEHAVDAAVAGKPVALRAAYNQLWVALALAAAVASLIVVASIKRNLGTFFVAG
jgi:uncharacterized iron-regulated membrane protein